MWTGSTVQHSLVVDPFCFMLIFMFWVNRSDFSQKLNVILWVRISLPQECVEFLLNLKYYCLTSTCCALNCRTVWNNVFLLESFEATNLKAVTVAKFTHMMACIRWFSKTFYIICYIFLSLQWLLSCIRFIYLLIVMIFST